MWWMMGENGGHYCSKKSDDLCGTQESDRGFGISRLCCILRGVDLKSVLFLLVIMPM